MIKQIGKKNFYLIISGLIILLLLIILFSFWPYKSLNKIMETDNIQNDKSDLIGAYIQQGEEYVKADTIPTSGYEFNEEESYCKIGDAIQEDMTLFYDMDTQTLTVSPIAKEGTKCYLYFDEKASGGDYILAGDNPPTNSTTDWTGGTSYYYTGNPNNWVQFGGFWWRIIRINGDGSIRMIYQGTSANTTGDGTQIGTSAFNSSYNRNAYVGYMYGNTYASDYASTHANTNSSTIKGILDRWYSNNLADEDEYIDGNAGFCGDRRVSSGTGTGTNITNYQPYARISSSSPSLSCETLDIYTTKESSTGNAALDYPIGLISADEAMFAGIPWYLNGSNTNNYLYTGQYYWTMSPGNFDSGDVLVFRVDSAGYLNGWMGNAASGVRPVINLRSDVALTGSGTTSDPFRIAGA